MSMAFETINAALITVAFLDQLVYQLYALSDEEIRIVEEGTG